MPDRTDIPVEEVLEPRRGRFGQLVAVAIVATTLLAALCGYMQARSLLHNDDALTRAQEWSALATHITDDTRQAEQLLLARYRRAQADSLHAAYLYGEHLWGPSQTDTMSQARDWQRLSAQINRDSGQLANGIRSEVAYVRKADYAALADPSALRVGDGHECTVPGWAAEATPPTVAHNRLGEGPDQDPNFPARYEADFRRTGYQLDALRAAANSEAAATNKQFTRYAVSLATLAVAVFLLGYSLTPHGRHHRKLYAIVAGLLVMGASLWGVYAAVRTAPAASPEAMAAYADGRVAHDRGDYRAAIRYFNCAISQDPNFAPAYQWRADAYLGTAATLFEVSPPALRHGIADAEKARSLGSDDPRLLNELSAMLYVTGIRNHDRELIGKAAAFMRQARRQDPADPVIAFNFAEDQLLLGLPSRSAYRAAEELALPDDPGAALAALSSLSNVAASPFGAEFHHSLAAAKHGIVASLAATNPQAAGTAAPPPAVNAGGGAPSLEVSLADGGSPSIYPGQFEFLIRSGRGFDPRRDRLYALWYQRSNSSWKVLDGVSGPIVAGTPTALGVDSAGRLFALKATHGCLPSGEYKLELYVNGTLAGQASQTVAANRLIFRSLPDMNFAYCRPAGWHALEQSRPGLLHADVSPAGDAAIVVADASAAAPGARDAGAVLRDVVHHLSRYLPAGLGRPRTIPNSFGGGMCGEQVDEYFYRTGTLAAGIGRDGYGREIVGIVYGPNGAFQDQPAASFSASDLFTSMLSDGPGCSAGS